MTLTILTELSCWVLRPHCVVNISDVKLRRTDEDEQMKEPAAVGEPEGTGPEID